jgi:hypothetical protein
MQQINSLAGYEQSISDAHFTEKLSLAREMAYL